MLNRESLPQLFSQIGHERMQQAQGLFEHRDQTRTRRASVRHVGFGGYRRFGKLDVPVTEIIPEKVIESLHHPVKVVLLELTIDVARGSIQPRQDPAIMQRQTRALAGEWIVYSFRTVCVQQT